MQHETTKVCGTISFYYKTASAYNEGRPLEWASSESTYNVCTLCLISHRDRNEGHLLECHSTYTSSIPSALFPATTGTEVSNSPESPESPTEEVGQNQRGAEEKSAWQTGRPDTLSVSSTYNHYFSVPKQACLVNVHYVVVPPPSAPSYGVPQLFSEAR